MDTKIELRNQQTPEAASNIFYLDLQTPDQNDEEG